VILTVAVGRAGVRLLRRELAGARLIAFEQQRDVDLRIAPSVDAARRRCRS
jgi:hypothetical protein